MNEDALARCFSDGSDVTRREFLRAGSSGAAVWTLGNSSGQAVGPRDDVHLIFLMLVGGPSHLETWDLKPDAPSRIRGPFRPIRTRVPGILIGEDFPRMAQISDQFALVRSVHHAAAPIHETGQQLMQTGRLSQDATLFPHYGSVMSYRGGSSGGTPPFVVLPGPIGNTGACLDHGQTSGPLGQEHGPLFLPGQVSGTPPEIRQALDLSRESGSSRDLYGNTAFGRDCLRARRLIEAGCRCVTVNMFQTVYDAITWDCHADGGSLGSDFSDYRATLCPTLDQAFSGLLEDLNQRGLLSRTLVVATGEFGRTPVLNSRGGRDHWPGVWSMLFAGAGIRGGQVIGSSDRLGGEPKDRPVKPEEVASTIYHILGMRQPSGRSTPGIPSLEAQPIRELLA